MYDLYLRNFICKALSLSCSISEAMDGAMRPPPVPQKAKRPQVAPPADEPAPKRIELLGEMM